MRMFPSADNGRRRAASTNPLVVYHHHHPICPDHGCSCLREYTRCIDSHKPREVIYRPSTSSAAGPSTNCAHSFYHSYEGDPSVDSCSLIPDHICEHCEEAKRWAIYPQLIRKSGCSCCVCLRKNRSPWPTPRPSERHQTRLSLPHEDFDPDSAQSSEVYENLYAV